MGHKINFLIIAAIVMLLAYVSNETIYIDITSHRTHEARLIAISQIIQDNNKLRLRVEQLERLTKFEKVFIKKLDPMCLDEMELLNEYLRQEGR